MGQQSALLRCEGLELAVGLQTFTCKNEKFLHSVPRFTLRTLAFLGKFTHVIETSLLVLSDVRTGKRMDSNIDR